MKNTRKTIDDRQTKILELVRSQGKVKAEDITKRFNISMMTVRRDLQSLEEAGLLRRVHGGAISLEKFHDALSKEEYVSFCREKISEYAAGLLSDGDTVFVNGSLTALSSLKYTNDKRITVYTNNCHAMQIPFAPGVNIRFTGGEMRGQVMVGEYVMRNLLTLTADKTLLGCAAIYDDGEFRYDIPTEIGINEAMISRTSKDLYILADHTKIMSRVSRENIYGSCVYDRPLTLITDDQVSSSIIEHLKQLGMRIIQVSTK